MVDTFKNVVERDNPADRWFLMTPHNSTNEAFQPRAVFCSADGTAQMVDSLGTVMPVEMVAGTFVPFRPVRINATSTTGTYYGLL
jgi:hypothetical protein